MNIGFFDTGLGGATIFKNAYKKINANYFFIADNKNSPYGVKDFETVQKLTEQNMIKLIKLDCKIIVLACNTATSAAISYLRAKYPDIIFIGAEPAIKPAIEDCEKRASNWKKGNKFNNLDISKNFNKINHNLRNNIQNNSQNDMQNNSPKFIPQNNLDNHNFKNISTNSIQDFPKIFLTATTLTLKGNKLFHLLTKLNATSKVELLPLDELVEFADESSEIRYDLAKEYLLHKFSKYNLENFSGIVLGCTHFPIFKKVFREILPDNIHIFDSADGITRNLYNKILEIDPNYEINDLGKTKVNLILTEESETFRNKFFDFIK